MGQTVFTAGQYSYAATLKPFNNFESLYQGLVVADAPIGLPGGYDHMAGKPGYDPNLIKMQRVPMGSRVKLWLPRFQSATYLGTAANYFYQIVWRVRSLLDANEDASDTLGAHFSRRLEGRAQIAGTPDSSGPRFVIPCAIESIQIPRTPTAEPEIVDVSSVQALAARGLLWRPPLMPSYAGSLSGHVGIYSQGFFPNGNNTSAGVPGEAAGPTYFTYTTEAQGDEMALLISRAPVDGSGAAAPNWDFTAGAVDSVLSQILGNGSGTLQNNPNIGVYVFTGTSA